MWPVELYTISDGPVLAVGALLFAQSPTVTTLESLSLLERTGAGAATALIVSMVLLGLLQGFGPRTVTKCRRSPVISICIGLPSILVVGGLAGTGYLMLGTAIGVFFGVPLVVLGATILPAVAAIGFVSIGTSIAARLGRDGLVAGILCGSVVAGLAAAVPLIAIVVASIAAAFGAGASLRVLISSRGAASPNERSVPPANQI